MSLPLIKPLQMSVALLREEAKEARILKTPAQALMSPRSPSHEKIWLTFMLCFN